MDYPGVLWGPAAERIGPLQQGIKKGKDAGTAPLGRPREPYPVAALTPKPAPVTRTGA